MAYSEVLAERIRASIGRRKNVAEKKMFGGIAFLYQGNMACGVVAEDLMLRLGKEGTSEALNEPHTRPMDFTGKVITTMLFVDAAGVRTDEQLTAWIERAIDFAKTLPAK